MRRLLLKIFLILAVLAAFSPGAKAQFKEEAFTQNYNDQRDSTEMKDSVDKVWSFREYFRGITHKDSTIKVGTMFAGSTVFIGGSQMYNRQYWKIPVFYAGIGGGIAMGIRSNIQFQKSRNAYLAAYEADPATTLTVDYDARRMRNRWYGAAAAMYWLSMMDGVVNYHPEIKHNPGKATVYSILVPGLGQCYNGEYWKVPIYWGIMIGGYHYYHTNATNYKRYKRIHNEATTDDSYDQPITAERALYYRNVFRRFRDYSMVVIVGGYLLQVIDANVFAYMRDFDVSDDLTMEVRPTVISPYNEYALNPSGSGGSFRTPATGNYAFGLKVGFTF